MNGHVRWHLQEPLRVVEDDLDPGPDQAIGDLLSRVLEAGGQRVTREYYFNDSGGQIRNLGASVAALRRGEPVPEERPFAAGKLGIG